MKNKNTTSDSILSIRLDDVAAAHLDYICGKTGLSRSVVLRRILGYIDDHETPVGHLTSFVAFCKRFDDYIMSAFSAALKPR